MSLYLIERTFPDGLCIPINGEGAATIAGVIANNDEQGVTWLYSYVSEDKKQSFCVYDGPSSETVLLSVAEKNRLPVNRITQVTVLHPYFYR